MELLVLVDNNTYIDVDAGGEPGVCFYIEDEGERILFDMGITDLFIKNAAFFGVDLSLVTKAAFSHGHYDHTRGADALDRAALRKAYPHCGASRLFCPPL